jgi:micrococcal nuclease
MFILTLPVVLGASNEAFGIVTNVVDGDTFDIRIVQTDPRIIYEIERVRLADVNCPEMSTPEGPPAKNLTAAILLNKTVWLDIDDRTTDGRDFYGRLVCVVYLADPSGQPIPTPCFNRILVDSGQAVIDDYTTNEFVPDVWWAPVVETVPEVTPEDTKYTPISASFTDIFTSPITTTGGMFVGSVKSNKYHYPSCRWAKEILPENEIWFSSSEDARAHGYVPCGTCKPP